RSAARGEMAPRKLIVFKHESELGNAPAQKLFDLVKVHKHESLADAPPRAFSDYTVTVGKPPAGVEMIEMI
ncbi:MAG TPA: type I-C CRISPR-associated protein Cas7/Csd2, partial [Verrucomicrobia bacterium]|nr:type I-C CRISPR-associated protein Cas7/Csd2 [Verrucomicrobiota bacterium]